MAGRSVQRMHRESPLPCSAPSEELQHEVRCTPTAVETSVTQARDEFLASSRWIGFAAPFVDRSIVIICRVLSKWRMRILQRMERVDPAFPDV